jgi:hypothetical protein
MLVLARVTLNLRILLDEEAKITNFHTGPETENDLQESKRRKAEWSGGESREETKGHTVIKGVNVVTRYARALRRNVPA